MTHKFNGISLRDSQTKDATVGDLKGQTIRSIQVSDDQILFRTDRGSYLMHHYQDCCESVADISGDLDDLIGSPLLKAEESSNSRSVGCDSCTWTFYHFATVKGYVTIRWLGQSNGYYSESVDFCSLIQQPKEG